MQFQRLLAAALTLVIAPAIASQTTAEEAALPPIGDPKKPPDGAPPHLQWIEREGLRRHAYWLADDARGGRYTSSSGQQATTQYIAEHFEQLGLRPLGDKRTFFQRYPLESVYIHKSTALTFGETEVTGSYALLPADTDDKVSLRGKFVWCGNGADADVPKLKGRIPVVVLTGDAGKARGGRTQAVQRYRAIAQKLKSKGATAAVVCLLADATTFGDVLTTNALLPDHPMLTYGGGTPRGVTRIPLFVLPKAKSLELFLHLGLELDQRSQPTADPVATKATGSLKILVKHDKKAHARNVVAVLDGTSKKAEAVVFSAHHDHLGQRVDGDVFNGADDNASGSAGLLEIAEAFAKGGPRPERSIIFLSVSGEELGLWGSAYYADHPTWPRSKIVANVNIDMIGRAGGDADRIEMQITPSHGHGNYSSMVRDAVALGEQFGIEFTSGDTYYRRSDHYNFAKKGIPVVFFCDGEHPDYHQVTDHPEKLGYPAMESIARLAFWTGWKVANDRARPKELGRQPAW